MSVKFQEAFSLDSARRRFEFTDHFLVDSLRDLWTNTLGSGGTGAVVDAVDGGIFRLGTPTASDSSVLDWGGGTPIRSLHVLKKVTMETRVRFNGGVTDTRREINLYFDTDNRIYFFHDNGSSSFRINCYNDGASAGSSVVDTVDTDWHIYRIECFPTDEIHFYIDNVETAGSPKTTEIPTDAGDYLMPRFYIATDGDSDPATSMDIDYVAIRQNR